MGIGPTPVHLGPTAAPISPKSVGSSAWLSEQPLELFAYQVAGVNRFAAGRRLSACKQLGKVSSGRPCLPRTNLSQLEQLVGPKPLRGLEETAQARRQRYAYWGHWSLTFWECDAVLPESGPLGPGRLIAEMPFPADAQGPMDGLAGSPERRRYRIGPLLD
jgi:hypothetical protein